MPKSGQPWDRTFLSGHPLFALLESVAGCLRTDQWPTDADYTRLAEAARLRSGRALSPLTFVTVKKPSRRDRRTEVRFADTYDGRIAELGQVPCLLASYHDLFNAVIFAAFPETKRALHARQYRALCAWATEGARALPGRRSREQDALTILDEGSVVVAMTRKRHAEFVACTRRSEVRGDGMDGLFVVPFGHAVLEHLHEGHQRVRSSAIVVPIDGGPDLGPSALLGLLDRELARRVASPIEFTEPGADAIVELEADGRLLLGPPKPGWALPYDDS